MLIAIIIKNLTILLFKGFLELSKLWRKKTMNFIKFNIRMIIIKGVFELISLQVLFQTQIEIYKNKIQMKKNKFKKKKKYFLVKNKMMLINFLKS